MKNFKEIDIKKLDCNLISLIGDEYTLITSGNSNGHNMMTASWGGFGVMWGKNIASIVVRPQRYTYEFLENNDYFTLSFFDPSYRDMLLYCGKMSGRDVDKTTECKLSPIPLDNSIGFLESSITMVCKKIYFNDINPNNFLDDSIDKNYSTKDYHRMYIGEILKVYIKSI